MSTDYLPDYSVKEMAEKIRIELIHQANEKRFKYKQASNRRFESEKVIKDLSEAADISAMYCFYSEKVLEFINNKNN